IANNGQVPADVAAVLGGLNKTLDNDQSIKRSVAEKRASEAEKLAKELGLEFTYEALVSSGESIARISKRLDTLKLYFDHPDYEFDDKQNKLLDSALPGYEGKSYRDLANMIIAITQNRLNPLIFDFNIDILQNGHKDVLLAQIKHHYPYQLSMVTRDFAKDPKFMLAVAKVNMNLLHYADVSLKKNSTFMLAVAKINVEALNYANKSLKKNFDFMLSIAKEIGVDAALIYVDGSLQERLLDTEEVGLLLVKNNGLVLKHLPKHTNNPQIVLAAVEQNKKAKAYIGMDLQAKINEAGGFDEFKKQQVKNSTSDRHEALPFLSHSNSPFEPSKQQEMS
ncbi:MAG: DUF4116 domain-containing protein, partial [Francisellaceae bacterium]